MKKQIACTIVLLMVAGLHAQTRSLIHFEKKVFYDVSYMYYINYPRGLEAKKIKYSTCTVQAKKSEFIIDMVRPNLPESSIGIPYNKEMINKQDTAALFATGLEILSDHYFSEIETYVVDNVTYKVWKHENYNCYDPFCGSRHGHMPFKTGETYFTTEYGMLFHFETQIQYEVLLSIKDHTVPCALIAAILTAKGADPKIIAQYKSDAGL